MKRIFQWSLVDIDILDINIVRHIYYDMPPYKFIMKSSKEIYMKVLVIGSGGREHAIAYALSKSPRVSEIHAIPG